MKTPTNREMIEQNARSITYLRLAIYAVVIYLVTISLALTTVQW